VSTGTSVKLIVSEQAKPVCAKEFVQKCLYKKDSPMKLEHKIPPPLLALLFAGLIVLTGRFLPPLGLAEPVTQTVALLLAGVAVLVVCAGGWEFRRAKTTVNPLKPSNATSLVSSGVFRFTRNPMYLGFSVMLLALCVFYDTLWGLFWLAMYMLFIQRFQILPEERAMQRLFGQEFEQ
jgi:protein-S-isoprenylcysteine O-methyltransferase Ste14